MNDQQKELQVILEENKIAEPETLKSAFAPLFDQAQALKDEAMGIVITSADQVSLMAQAKTLRKTIRDIRLNAEKEKDRLKESALREGRAVQGLYNLILHLTKPLEEHLEQQEKYIEFENAKKLAALKDKRVEELTAYGVDISFLKLEEMSEDVYAHFLAKAKSEYEAKKEAEATVEAERIEKQLAEEKERECIRQENEKLKKKAEQRETEVQAEKEKDRIEAERIAAENLEVLAAEREKQKALEDQIKEKQLEEARRMEAQKAEEEAKIKAEKEAELAPDKKKLEALALQISKLELPTVTSPEAKTILTAVVSLLEKTATYIKEQTINL